MPSMQAMPSGLGPDRPSQRGLAALDFDEKTSDPPPPGPAGEPGKGGE
jgi:hypothetical protein